MNERITGYVIDTDNLDLYTKEFNLSIKGIRESMLISLIGMTERHIEGIPYTIIYQRWLDPEKNYTTTTITKEGKPDLKNTLMIVKKFGTRIVSLDEDDIELIDGNISIYTVKCSKTGGFSSSYVLQLSDTDVQSNQTYSTKDLKDLEKVY